MILMIARFQKLANATFPVLRQSLFPKLSFSLILSKVVITIPHAVALLPQGISHVPHVADLSNNRSPFLDILMTSDGPLGTIRGVYLREAKRTRRRGRQTEAQGLSARFGLADASRMKRE
jgi:hypothetical protein